MITQVCGAFLQVCVCMYVCMYVCVCVCMCVCACVCNACGADGVVLDTETLVTGWRICLKVLSSRKQQYQHHLCPGACAGWWELVGGFWGGSLLRGASGGLQGASGTRAGYRTRYKDRDFDLKETLNTSEHAPSIKQRKKERNL